VLRPNVTPSVSFHSATNWENLFSVAGTAPGFVISAIISPSLVRAALFVGSSFVVPSRMFTGRRPSGVSMRNVP
jgi:hypothetical protein